MQVLLIVVGIALIGVGLVFAYAGFAQNQAGGSTSVAKLEGPAWLVLVGLGVGLIVFSATANFDGDSSPVETSSEQDSARSPAATDDAVPPSTPVVATPRPVSTAATGPQSPTSPPVTGCVATIDNPFSSLRETAEPFGQEIMRIPAGTYPVVEHSTESFAGRDSRWLKLRVDGVEGWIEDNTILVASKAGCSF